ncbi:hypothetical protein GobsT_27960 [Gemmata obscuriglobus]|uniref:Uncharacterized protein n=1 Tax=Gemmata obscuriglobus TaxID=114 RepID=A0A2Z3HCI6_9BACT|nr:hypothetical protein [Gemmata obscuriglobus]AWM38960.1 hypothetical protein C1280_19525 [Gemmata obscuriglobus]QEG28027.1 hypothetical protein GobsT_27960 [Gemmata obscuriglobus]VTS05580.1 unnamed protein product [Gemmata obscuriglobus UQM 2246]
MGRFLSDNFEATHQKVGTFQVVNGVKIGGNVASYFCLSDGTVIHAVAGPLGAKEFLREARWAVDLRKLAASEAGGDPIKYRLALRKGHLERLASENGLRLPPRTLPVVASGPPPVPTSNEIRTKAGRALGNQGQVHTLLAYYPLPQLSQLYTIVFEDVLKEKVSTLPVDAR